MRIQLLRRPTAAGFVALLTAFALPIWTPVAAGAGMPAGPASKGSTVGATVAGGLKPGDLVGRDREGRLWVHPWTGVATRPSDPAVRTLEGPGWQAPNVLALADVSLDGKADLFTRDPAGDGSVGYHATRTNAGWDPATRVLGMAGWNGAAAVLAEDIDQNGTPDLLARQSGGNLRVWPHDGNTTASPWLTKPAYDVAEGLERTDLVTFGEVTGDGLRDLVIREDDGTVWVLPHPGAAAPTRDAAITGQRKQTSSPRWRWNKQQAKSRAVTLRSSSTQDDIAHQDRRDSGRAVQRRGRVGRRCPARSSRRERRRARGPARHRQSRRAPDRAAHRRAGG